MDKNYSDNKSRAGETEIIKDQKMEGIDHVDKKNCPDNFLLSGQKGIYHQVEFCRLMSVADEQTDGHDK